MPKFVLVTVVGLLALLVEASATCGECSTTSNAACLTDTTFEICLPGTDGLQKTGIQGSCGPGQVCTAEAGVCKYPTSTLKADCGDTCNECVGNFACVSKTEFALCVDSEPTDIVMTCPPKKVCNSGSALLCVNCDEDPTCSNDVVKALDPVADFAANCKGKTIAGFYPNKYDTTCKSYVFCQMYMDEMKSILYKCPYGYFDPTTTKCVTNTKPVGCD